jgi:DNA (cytosine-5)-methyltransferase 1
MRFGSVCSGIEAASVAWHPLGWEAAWLSEIEPFPCAVLKHHYPDVPNYGDMTLLPDRILSGEVEAPDLFCGGTPCQAFSVAGLRNSLDDARGNLSLTFVGIANAIDHVRSVRRDSPAIIFWENVPGVLNTKDNAFGCFLGALAGESDPVIAPGDKWSNAGCVYGPQRTVAWRVLDAQYFGVAQRRRRVFVVASARDDINPAEILFEFEGVRRDIAPRREARQEVAGTIAARFGISRNNHEECVVAPTLTADFGDKLGQNNQHIDSQKGGMFVPSFMQPTFAIQGSMIGRSDSAGPQGDGINVEVCFTQNTIDRHAVAHTQIFENHGTDSRIKPVEVCPTVTSRWGTGGNNVPLSMQPILGGWDYENNAHGPNDVTGPLLKGSPTEGGRPLPAIALQSMAVRRLTPTECERLQGFPDNYSNIPWRGKLESPDGPRYKALGNSWAVPVVRWIGKRIQERITT